ncbi:HAD family hydrolase [Candidatus Uhrbacteria bacterium]|nr:HAD family hydrolase [Candidatus Uhrbacteria bacterium]
MARHTKDCVEVVCFDAINTILEPKGGRQALLARIVKKVTGIDVAPDVLWAKQQEIRSRYPRSGQDMEEYFPRTNVHFLREIGISNGDLTTAARRVHEGVIGDFDEYEVRDDMRELIMWTASRVKAIAIASNHRQSTLLKLLREYGIAEHFGNRVFTSSRVRHPKPSKKFFQAIRRALGLRYVSQLGLVGNSLVNDAPAAHLGIRTVILDRSGSVAGLQASLPAGVRAASNMAEVQQWIIDICALPSDEPVRQSGDTPTATDGNEPT